MTVSNYFERTNIQTRILTSLAGRKVLAYGTFGGVGVKLQVFSGPRHQLALVTNWPLSPSVDMSIYVVFTSREHVNLYTTLDFKAAGVLYFRLKYDSVFSEV